MGTRVPIDVVAVPKHGKLTVRFLESVRTMLTHWAKKRSVACPGAAECKAHEFPRLKGYAAVERWDSAARRWVPCVLELTESAIATLGTADLRGSCWEFSRRKTRYGGSECVGERLAYASQSLPAGFDVSPTVERLYRTTRIEWDVPADVYLPATAECSTADPPPARVEPKDDPAKAAEFSRFVKDQARKMSVPSNGQA